MSLYLPPWFVALGLSFGPRATLWFATPSAFRKNLLLRGTPPVACSRLGLFLLVLLEKNLLLPLLLELLFKALDFSDKSHQVFPYS